MDKDRKTNDDLTDLSDFSKKYDHYLNDDSDVQSEDVKGFEDTMQFEDVNSYSDEAASLDDVADEEEADMKHSKKSKDKSNGNFFSRNRFRNTKIIALLIVIAILLTLGGALAYLYFSTSDGRWNDDGIDHNGDVIDEDYLVEDDHDFQAMGDVNADSLNDFLYSWANNGGEKMYNKNIINVLLCGVDSETGDSTGGRSDIMMLVSINKINKTITMVSLLRDSWTYMRVPKKDGTTYDYYFKLNSAYIYGGPTTLLETIENNYKIKIDEFIAVDFNSFPKLIDALGGVTVDVQQYEANYIRRTSSQKDFPSGTATLTGKQALIYSRIRKCDADSDISRTRRQRSVIKGLIDSAKSATNGQLLNAFQQVSGYLRTGYSQSEVFALIAQAYAQNWLSYEMVELVLPSEDFVDRASSYIGGHWAWVVDYALCAQKLQKALYGETNIILSDDRDSVLDLVTNRRETTSADSGNSSGGYYHSTTSTQYTGDYEDDVSTLPSEDETSETETSWTFPTWYNRPTSDTSSEDTTSEQSTEQSIQDSEENE